MMSYVEIFEHFVADQLIDKGESDAYDQLIKNTPSIVIEIEDVDSQYDNTLRLFSPVNGQRKVLGKTKEGQLLLFNEEKVRTITKKRLDFVRK